MQTAQTALAPLVALAALALPPASAQSSATGQVPPPPAAMPAADAEGAHATPRVPPPRVTEVAARLVASGPVLRVQLAVEVANPAEVAQDFELLFPLGRGGGGTGVVSDLAVRLDGRELQGEHLSAERAREAFARMASERRDPTLLEHYGEAVYRARVAGMAPGSTRELELAYTGLVETREGGLRLHLPLTAFRRSAGPARVVIDGEIRSERPASALYSPTHDVVEGRPFVTWEGATPHQHQPFRVEVPASACDADFEVFYSTRADGQLLDVTLLSERPDPGEDGYFLAVLHGAPDDTIVPEAKNVVFVVDRSGSMKDVKIAQARDALAFMLSRLRPEDRFNVVSYSKDVRLFAETLVAPTPGVLADAQGFVAGIEAEGGTNIAQALEAALAQFADTSLVNQIVFLTDGLPTEGEKDTSRLCALVREANRHRARLIAFGLGFDVNGVLLDRLAEENRGMSEYVLPDQPIEERVPGFYSRMQAPLLLDAQVTFEGGGVHDVFPRAVGDLYGGHKLVLTGRYSTPGPVRLKIAGRRGLEAQEHAFDFRLAADTSGTARDVVARIWAAKKIGFLVDEIRLDGETPERIEAIVRLGTRFGVLTEYTAFLADEATDLYAFGANVEACTAEVGKSAGVAAGTHGVAQASNSKSLQRGDQAITCNTWVGADGRTVTIANVQCIAGKAFFRKGGTWLQSDLAGEVDAEVALYSPEFFALLDRNPWLGACVARTGDVTVAVEGRNVRVTSG